MTKNSQPPQRQHVIESWTFCCRASPLCSSLECNTQKAFQPYEIGENYCSKQVIKWQFQLHFMNSCQWPHSVVVIATAQLHSTMPELRFFTSSSPAHGITEISLTQHRCTFTCSEYVWPKFWGDWFNKQHSALWSFYSLTYNNIRDVSMWKKGSFQCMYSQTYIRQPLLEPLKNGHLGQVVIL